MNSHKSVTHIKTSLYGKQCIKYFFLLTVCSFSRLTCSSSECFSLCPWSSLALSSEHSPFSRAFSLCSIHSSDSFTMEEATAGAGPGEGLRSPPLLVPSPLIIEKNYYTRVTKEHIHVIIHNLAVISQKYMHY